jgi:hypothetical protein
MSDDLLPAIKYEGVHCTLAINRPAPAIVVVVLEGSDIGEFADFPLQELAKDLGRFSSIELFIDARAVRSASVQVSGEWALWMNGHRHRFKQISMLSGSRYIEITAQFVRRFTGLADRMRIYTDAAAFDQGLDDSVRLARVALVPGGGVDDATAG